LNNNYTFNRILIFYAFNYLIIRRDEMQTFLGKLILVIFIVGSVSVNYSQVKENKSDNNTDLLSAVCILYPTEGNETTGIVKFTQTSEGIKIVADVKGLTPGKHGFHIHQFGDCSLLDGKSAGGHFNPDDKKHGAPDGSERHVGDLGNLVADEEGNAHFEWTDSYISFTGMNSVLGRAIIVHAGEDDLTSQPTGNAGARLACGVIGLAKQ
jgi:Cu-Zn family superoxide dismutase